MIDWVSSVRLLVFGKTGQVATALQRQAAATGYDFQFLGRDEVDLGLANDYLDIIDQCRADVVINAAAYTAVDRAEEEYDVAYAVNAVAPPAMAMAAEKKRVPFIHISTDYVFDGSGDQPWRPEDPPRPINSYGRTKAEGEAGIAATAGRNVVLRTSWVFSEDGSNFLRTMLRIGKARSSVRVVCDQIGGPTGANDIAKCLLTIALQEHAARTADRPLSGTGIAHYSGRPYTSWAGLAEVIFAYAKMDVQVEPVTTPDYPTPAKRPNNSRLDMQSIRLAYGILPPDWRKTLRATIEKIRNDM